MFSFLSRGPRWRTSEFSELPNVPKLPNQSLRDYGLVAGGLALVLSRCSPREVDRHFKAASQAYRTLQTQARRNRPVRLPPQLLSDVSHEVAEFVDKATRSALLRCMTEHRRG